MMNRFLNLLQRLLMNLQNCRVQIFAFFMVLGTAFAEAGPRKTILLIGPSGVGKSTLVGLFEQLQKCRGDRLLLAEGMLTKLPEDSADPETKVVGTHPVFPGSVIDLKVIDTPGFANEGAGLDLDKVQNIIDVLATHPVHAIVVVISNDTHRSIQPVRKMIEEIICLFPDQRDRLRDHIKVVATKVDSTQADIDSVAELASGFVGHRMVYPFSSLPVMPSSSSDIEDREEVQKANKRVFDRFVSDLADEAIESERFAELKRLRIGLMEYLFGYFTVESKRKENQRLIVQKESRRDKLIEMARSLEGAKNRVSTTKMVPNPKMVWSYRPKGSPAQSFCVRGSKAEADAFFLVQNGYIKSLYNRLMGNQETASPGVQNQGGEIATDLFAVSTGVGAITSIRSEHVRPGQITALEAKHAQAEADFEEAKEKFLALPDASISSAKGTLAQRDVDSKSKALDHISAKITQLQEGEISTIEYAGYVASAAAATLYLASSLDERLNGGLLCKKCGGKKTDHDCDAIVDPNLTPQDLFSLEDSDEMREKYEEVVIELKSLQLQLTEDNAATLSLKDDSEELLRKVSFCNTQIGKIIRNSGEIRRLWAALELPCLPEMSEQILLNILEYVNQPRRQ